VEHTANKCDMMRCDLCRTFTFWASTLSAANETIASSYLR